MRTYPAAEPPLPSPTAGVKTNNAPAATWSILPTTINTTVQATVTLGVTLDKRSSPPTQFFYLQILICITAATAAVTAAEQQRKYRCRQSDKRFLEKTRRNRRLPFECRNSNPRVISAA